MVATGSEVPIALAARDLLAGDGVGARVVSMPCREWFADQPLSYQDQVLPPSVRARVSVEAAAAHDSLRDAAGPVRPGGHQQTAAPTTGGTGDRPA